MWEGRGPRPILSSSQKEEQCAFSLFLSKFHLFSLLTGKRVNFEALFFTYTAWESRTLASLLHNIGTMGSPAFQKKKRHTPG